jgi:hypothetical protein
MTDIHREDAGAAKEGLSMGDLETVVQAADGKVTLTLHRSPVGERPFASLTCTAEAAAALSEELAAAAVTARATAGHGER